MANMNIPTDDVSSATSQWLVGAMAAIPMAILAVQKLWKGWATDRVDRISADAQADTVEGLQSENVRLRLQNTELITTLMEAQRVTLRMASENTKMQIEIEELRITIERLLKAAGKDS